MTHKVKQAVSRMGLIGITALLMSSHLVPTNGGTRTQTPRRFTLQKALRLSPDDSPRKTNAANRVRRARKQKHISSYAIYNASAIHRTLFDMAETYPDLVTLTSAQELYGLPAAGGDKDCPFDHPNDANNRRRLEKLHHLYTARGERGFPRTLQKGNETTAAPETGSSSSSPAPLPAKGCYNYILTIEDKRANPPPDKTRDLPEIFLSGEVHGNERVGPTAVVETARQLLAAAHCESLPHGQAPLSNDPPERREEWNVRLDEAKVCREELRDRGVDDGARQWLARLVATRRIVILPSANALGYFRDEREEDGVDPNRDFPYDLKDGEQCMRTIAARCINEIFRDHMFQLAITFHAGSSSVTYEWGAPTYEGELSPDDEALKQLVNGYVRYGGAFPLMNIKQYDMGTMNDVVYSVRGGMEDWAYAGSWDKDRVRPCHPDTYGGYDESKTIYDDASLRVVNTLVEASNIKTPPHEQLGTDEDVFNPDSSGTGHIPRNIRLSLLMADIVQPYASVRYVNGLQLEDDIVPLRENGNRLCKQTRVLSVPKDDGKVTIEWTVGGGFNIDKSGLLLAKWDELPEYFDGASPPTQKAYRNLIKAINGNDKDHDFDFFIPPPSKEGRTRWHKNGLYPDAKNKDPYGGPIFTAEVPLKSYQVGDEIAVYAYAKLDSYWKTQPDSISPDVPPQTHFVNARTNSSWSYDHGNQTIKGRLFYFSVPVTIVVGPEGSQLEELSERLPVRPKWENLGEEVIDGLEVVGEEVIDGLEVVGEEVIEEVEDHPGMTIFMGVGIGFVVLIAMYGIGRTTMRRRIGKDGNIELKTTRTIN